MSVDTPVLTPTRLREGVWEAVIQCPDNDTPPAVAVTHLEKPVEGARVSKGEGEGQWILRVPIPLSAISEGVQTFLVQDVGSNERIGSFTVIAGEVLGEDIRAEMDLLRAELDMLKKAFRRHCLETM